MQIKFIRPKQFADRLRPYKIFINDKHVEDIKSGKEKICEVPEGNHDIYLKVDWCTSNTLSINKDKGEYILNCSNTCAGWKMFIPIIPFFYTTFNRRNYLTLKEF